MRHRRRVAFVLGVTFSFTLVGIIGFMVTATEVGGHAFDGRITDLASGEEIELYATVSHWTPCHGAFIAAVETWSFLGGEGSGGYAVYSTSGGHRLLALGTAADALPADQALVAAERLVGCTDEGAPVVLAHEGRSVEVWHEETNATITVLQQRSSFWSFEAGAFHLLHEFDWEEPVSVWRPWHDNGGIAPTHTSGVRWTGETGVAVLSSGGHPNQTANLVVVGEDGERSRVNITSLVRPPDAGRRLAWPVIVAWDGDTAVVQSGHLDLYRWSIGDGLQYWGSTPTNNEFTRPTTSDDAIAIVGDRWETLSGHTGSLEQATGLPPGMRSDPTGQALSDGHLLRLDRTLAWGEQPGLRDHARNTWAYQRAEFGIFVLVVPALAALVLTLSTASAVTRQPDRPDSLPMDALSGSDHGPLEDDLAT